MARSLTTRSVTARETAAETRGSWGLLAVLSGTMLLDALEVSTAIVALPALAADLGIGAAGATWVVGAFALGFGGLLIVLRNLAARWGERQAYLAALALFAAASVVCALADAPAILVAARLVKGACAALTAPTGLAFIARYFPEGPPRHRAISVYTFLGAWGFTLGLIISGLLTAADWRWTFLLPAPVALVLLVSGLRLLPATPGGPPPRLQIGALLVHAPLVRSALGAATLNGTVWGLLVEWTFRLQDELGWTSLQAGIALVPASLPAALVSPVAGRLVRRFGTARQITAGAALVPLGCLLAWSAAHERTGSPAAYAVDVLPWLLLVGTGFAMCFSSLHIQALSGLEPARHGAASAAYQTMVQLGGVLVLALVSVTANPVALTLVGLLGFLIALTGVIPVRRTV
ncbi:MFS transporter [Spirillospora sp. NPDC000708]